MYILFSPRQKRRGGATVIATCPSHYHKDSIPAAYFKKDQSFYRTPKAWPKQSHSRTVSGLTELLQADSTLQLRTLMSKCFANSSTTKVVTIYDRRQKQWSPILWQIWRPFLHYEQVIIHNSFWHSFGHHDINNNNPLIFTGERIQASFRH